MSKCKVCGYVYHACLSCGLEPWEYNFCSIECRVKYEEEKIKEVSIKFNISVETLKQLKEEMDFL